MNKHRHHNSLLSVCQLFELLLYQPVLNSRAVLVMLLDKFADFYVSREAASYTNVCVGRGGRWSVSPSAINAATGLKHT